MVLPFENPTQEPRLTWMREGAAILLSETLAAAGEIVVDREERLQAFDRLQLPASAQRSAAPRRSGSARRSARRSSISGTVAMQGDQLIARARVVRLDTGRLLPEVEARGPLADLFAVFGALAQQIRASPRSPPPRRRSPAADAAGLRALRQGAGRRNAVDGAGVSRAGAQGRAAIRSRAAGDLGPALRSVGDHQRALDAVSAIRPESRFSREGRFRRALSLMQSEALRRGVAGAAAHADAKRHRRRSRTRSASWSCAARRRSQPGRATYYFSQASELDPADGDCSSISATPIGSTRIPRRRSTGCARRCAAIPATATRTSCSAWRCSRPAPTSEATRERELADAAVVEVRGVGERAAAGGDPVPRGLERLHEELMPSRARVDTIDHLRGPARSGEPRDVPSRRRPPRVRARSRSRGDPGAAPRAVSVAVSRRSAPAAGPPVPARRASGGGRRGAEDRAVERGDRRRARGLAEAFSRSRTRPRPASRSTARWPSTRSRPRRWP